MKKLSTLLVLLLTMLVGGVNCAYAADGVWKDRYIKTVSAALTSVDDLHDGYYLLRNVGRQTFLRENDNNVLWLWNATNGKDDLATVKTAFEGYKKDLMSSVVYITKNEGGASYTMQFRSHKYMPRTLTHGGETKSNETAGNIEVGYISGNQFNFRPTDGEYANGNGNGGYSEGFFVGWEKAVPGANGNGAYQFFPVELDVRSLYVTDCNWTVTDGTNTLMTYTQKNVDLGTTATIPFEFSYYYTNPTIQETDLVVSETNCNFTVHVNVGEMPFKPSTWYTVKFRRDQTGELNRENCYLIHATKDAEKIGSRNNQMTADFILGQDKFTDKVDAFNGALWAFVPDGLGVKLLCKQNGKYVTCSSSTAETFPCTMDNVGTTFIVKTNSAGGGFSLQIPGNPNGHLGDHFTEDKLHYLGVWNNGGSQDDNGSNFQITEASTEDVFNVGKEVYTSVVNGLTANEADATQLTAGTEASLRRVKTLLENATTVEGLDAAFAHRNYAYPKEGAWYRIKNVNLNSNEKTYISSEGIFVKTDGNLDASVDRTVRRKSENDNLVSQLWTMKENADGTYRVVNANTNRALNAYTGNNVDMPTNVDAGGRYFFRTVPNAFEGITETDLELMAYGDTDPQNAYCMNAYGGRNNDVINYWHDHSDKGNYWKFIEVTEIPVKISKAAGWASLALPFEVTIPAESGVVAYTAQRVDADKLILSEITDGIIPANEGVILGKEGGADVKLAITHTGKANIEGNKLVGATAKRIGFAAESTYALALDETGQAAFLRNGLDCIPANKAYLLAEEVPNLTTTKLSFNFGTVNGINDAVAEDAQAETYYDLNGRVVLYPHNGIFVTKSGKKVFIK